MKKAIFTNTILIGILIINTNFLLAQNTAITDSTTYLPHSSAMLDVMSSSKGVLVPRMTSAQRVAISNPANGLLVFDATEGSFFFYNNSTWHNLSQSNGNIWSISGNNVFLTNPNYKIGVGTSTPTAGLTVSGNAATTVNDTLFVVRNKDGEPVFAVFPEGVRVWMEDGAKGSAGGFAVSGRSASKVVYDYLTVTSDSVRIYLNDSATKSSAGGFAVSGRSANKSNGNEFLRITPDSTRIYTQDTVKGFGVGNIGNGTAKNYIQLTPLNYFIGHESGQKIQFDSLNPERGKQNIFIGYQSGKNATTAYNNITIGYKAGFNLQSGVWNTFIGHEAGYSCQHGLSNLFMGYRAGYNFIDGTNNIFIGKESGLNVNETVYYNLFVGNNAGKLNQSGSFNTYLGMDAGHNAIGESNTMVGSASGFGNTGSQNVFLGYHSGIYTSTSNKNICIGFKSGFRSTGSGNIFIGTNANNTNFSTSTYSNCIGIGDSVIVTANNQVKLGNTQTQSLFCIGAYYSTTTAKPNLYVNSSGQILRSTYVVPLIKSITPLKTDSKNIYNLEAVSINYENSANYEIGLNIAKTSQIIPDIIIYDEENGQKNIPINIDYNKLSILLLKEIQNHESTIKTLQQQLNEHAILIEQLLKENNELRKK